MRLHDSAGPDTGRADSGPLMGAVDHHPDSLQVGVPASFGYVMSVTDIVSEQWPFPTNLAASRHKNLQMTNRKLTF